MTDLEVIAKWLHSQSPSPDDSRPIKFTAADFMAQAGAFITALADAGRVIVPRELTPLVALAGLAAGGTTDTLADIHHAIIAAGADNA